MMQPDNAPPPVVFDRFDNSFARRMPGFFVAQGAVRAPQPRLIAFNAALARRLGLDPARITPEVAAAVFSGSVMPQGAAPLAQVYAGHQFGGFSPRLGDGRALLIGEVVAPDGMRFDIQLKGAGPTPYSRGGDGFSALGPVLREYLVSEAMAALGIPTTRALAAVATGGYVLREDVAPGGVLTRVAASHIRIGTFQYFAARGEGDKLRQLLDYVLARHYPCITGADRALAFFEAVIAAQAALVARWMLAGFIHGVMNTDNTTISGETIDYGPCAFMDAYNPRQVFSSIDREGRYAFANQPVITQWNLARLGETLIDLVDPDETRAIARLTDAIETFPGLYEAHWLAGMRAKLGLGEDLPGDTDLIRDLLATMARCGADFTQSFRALSDVVRGDAAAFTTLFDGHEGAAAWRALYTGRQGLERRPPAARAAGMDAVNPLYIPRNHLVEEALDAAVEQGDLAPFHRLMEALAAPYTQRPGLDAFAAPRPGHCRSHRTFCGT